MLYLTAGIALLFALFSFGVIFSKAAEKKRAEEQTEKIE